MPLLRGVLLVDLEVGFAQRHLLRKDFAYVQVLGFKPGTKGRGPFLVLLKSE